MFRTYGRISSVTASNLTLHARNLFIDLSISPLHVCGLLHLALKGRWLTFEFEEEASLLSASAKPWKRIHNLIG